MQLTAINPNLTLAPATKAAAPTANASKPEAAAADPTDQVVYSRANPPSKPLWPAQEVAKAQSMVAQQATPLFANAGGVLFPDSCGRVTNLALQFGNTEFHKPLPEETKQSLLGVWDQLMTHMSPDTQFTIVCADQNGIDSIHQLEQKTGIDPNRVHILPANSQNGTSIWIRDSMLPVQDGTGKTKLIIQDRTYWPGPDDNKVPPIIAGSSPQIYSEAHPELRIDGGNILTNGHQAFIGNDSIGQERDLLQSLAKDPEKAKEIQSFYEQETGNKVGQNGVTPDKMWEDLPTTVFQHEFHKPVLVIGKDDPTTPIIEAQPAFHIDMAVTTIGEKKVLVGDPGMACDMLKALSPEERKKVNDEMIAAGHFAPDSDIVGNLIQENDTDQRRADFNNTAKELKDAGYEVERIPDMIGRRTTWSLPYLTYNNCIMEDYKNDKGEEVKKVYLPQYGCAPMDKYCADVYQKNGYEVVPLQMSPVSKLEGAIRCSAYPIQREQTQPQ